MEKVIVRIDEVTGEREEVTTEDLMDILGRVFRRPEEAFENLLVNDGSSVLADSGVYSIVMP